MLPVSERPSMQALDLTELTGISRYSKLSLRNDLCFLLSPSANVKPSAQRRREDAAIFVPLDVWPQLGPGRLGRPLIDLDNSRCVGAAFSRMDCEADQTPLLLLLFKLALTPGHASCDQASSKYWSQVLNTSLPGGLASSTSRQLQMTRCLSRRGPQNKANFSDASKTHSFHN